MALARDFKGRYSCPECGSNVLRLEVMQKVVVRFDEDDHEVIDGPEGDMEWDDETYTTCTGCNLGDRLLKFDPEGR